MASEDGAGVISPPGATTTAVDVAAAMGHVDWAATSVGATASWPSTLQTMVRVLLGSRFSMWMGWGRELAFFYNDAYATDTLDTKHPWALGKPASTVWAEIWPDIGPRIEHVLATGEATWDENLLLIIRRSGYDEETYHTFSYSPLFDADAIVGLLCVVSETTIEVIGDRRMATLRDLATGLSASITEADVARAVTRCLGANPRDVPFSLTYLLDDDGVLRLVAATGVAPGQEISPLVLDAPEHGAWVRELRTSLEVPLGERFADIPSGAWEAPATQALLVPITESGQEQTAGFLAVGINPHRLLDTEYRGFVELVAGQIAAAVTSVRAFEAERRRSEALAALDQAKTTFFTNISHEFRTPLTLLLAPLEDALASGLDADNRVRLDLAHRNALRLLKLVNALLDFSRLEAGGLQASLAPIDLAVETAEVAGMFRSAIEAGGVELVVDCAPLASRVLADRSMWELIVTNLLSNAFKHTFDGRIEVRLHEGADEVHLDVVDTGIGIPDDQLPHLFARFHRVAGAPSRSHEGSGVGLSLVRELVALHAGRVDVVSEEGRGTTFRVSIPAQRRATPRAHEPEENVHRSRSRTVAAHLAEVTQWVDHDGGVPDEAPAPAGSVLVVDDNADMRSYLHRLLSPRFHVRTAVDGADALKEIARHAPDLVVSDVMMPVVDGLELVRRLRESDDHADLPVILLSARAGAEASVEGLDVGADDYLVKPFSGDELIGRVAARLASGSERRRHRAVARLADDLRDLTEHEQVVSALRRVGSELFGAAQAVLAVRDGVLIRNHFAPGLRHGLAERYHLIDERSSNPVSEAMRTGAPVVISSAAEMDERFPELASDHRSAGGEAAVVVALTDRLGEVTGSLALVWNTPQHLGEEMVRSVALLGEVVARAVDRIRLWKVESRVAEEIQAQFLELDPRTLTGVVAARYRPADASLVVGGDWYDAIAIDDRRVGIAVGDVVGHGLPAALAMGQLRSALAAAAARGSSPADTIDAVDSFARRIPEAHCTTLAYCTITVDAVDTAGALLQWSAAGHPPPIVLDDLGATVLWEGRSRPLGVRDGHGTPIGEVVLRPGSLVLLYTDGLVERRGASLDGRIEALRRSLERHRAFPVGELCDRVIADMTAGAGAGDDMALIAVRLTGAMAERFVDVIPAVLPALAGTRRRLREWLRERALDERRVDEVLLAIGEAVSNAVEHGSRHQRERTVGIEVHAVDGSLVAAITDSGAWDRDSARSAQDSRGRGFQIMQTLSERVTVDRGRLGTTLTLVLPTER